MQQRTHAGINISSLCELNECVGVECVYSFLSSYYSTHLNTVLSHCFSLSLSFRPRSHLFSVGVLCTLVTARVPAGAHLCSQSSSQYPYITRPLLHTVWVWITWSLFLKFYNLPIPELPSRATGGGGSVCRSVSALAWVCCCSGLEDPYLCVCALVICPDKWPCTRGVTSF